MPSSATIEALKTELEDARKRVTALEQAIAILSGDAVLVAGANYPLPLRHSTEFAGLGIADAATRFIKEIGEPKSTREIADAILSRGFETKSKNFTATVYATLVNSKKFKRTKDDRWEPIEKD